MTQLKTATDHSNRIYLLTGVFAAVLYTVLLVAPVIAGPLIVKFDLSPAQVGLLFSLELGAFSLATVPAYLWLTRVPLTAAVTVCTVIVAAGHFVSGFITDFGLLLVTRLITSLAAGSITVVLLALGPRTRNPGRAFGIFVVAQLAMGAAILALFPVIYAGADVSAMYWTLAGLTVLCLPFVPVLRGISLRAPASEGHEGLDPAKRTRFVAGLAAILLFYVALSGVWSFMGQIAMSAGAEEGAVSIVLSIATAAGVASALIATLMGDSPRRGLYLILGLAGMAVSVLLLLGSGALVVFVIAAILFKFAWTFVLPYLLSGVSALGGGAHTMNTTNLMIGGGFVIGPIISGWLVQTSGNFSSMIWFATICLIASLGCAWVLSSGRLIEPSAPGQAPEQTPDRTGLTAV